MNDIMSYQYPPPGTPPPPYNGYPVALHMAGMGMRSPDQPGRNGSPNLSFDLKRANSRPNIKTDPDSEDSNMASADNKKRHKLMYHRAAAACSKPPLPFLVLLYPEVQDHPGSGCPTQDQLILTDVNPKRIVDAGKYGVRSASLAKTTTNV